MFVTYYSPMKEIPEEVSRSKYSTPKAKNAAQKEVNTTCGLWEEKLGFHT